MLAKGTYTELQRSGVDFTSLLQIHDEEESQLPAQETVVRSRTLSQNSVVSQTSSVHSVKDGDHLPVCSALLCIRFLVPELVTVMWEKDYHVPNFFQGEAVQTVVEESRGEGNIKFSLYLKYLRAGANILVLVLMVLINLLAQVNDKILFTGLYTFNLYSTQM